jgi:hypothetical protein
MTHQRVLDVCEALLVQPVLLDGIIYEVEGGMADDVGRARIACK